MKRLSMTQHGKKFHVEGYPDSVALKRIDDSDARELQALTLHQSDMNFCRAAMEQLEKSRKSDEGVIAQALWLVCVACFFKCFGSSKSRTSLSANEVLKNHTGAMQVFDYFKALRDKHVIHDENAYCQAFTAVALNAENASSKVADVIAIATNASTIDDAHVTQFKQLVETTNAWVSERREALHQSLAQKYEQWAYKDLLALPDIQYTAPTASSVRTKR